MIAERVLNQNPLPKEFFLKRTVDVAKALLGKGLVVLRGKDLFVVEIVEVEAYLGVEDPASHSYGGLTKRNWPMFESGGTCYIYLSYGVNYCANVVTGPRGIGEAVLLRAAAPHWGEAMMLKNRSNRRGLLNGPGKLTQALGLDLSYNGLTLDQRMFKIIDLKNKILPSHIGCSPRIGISRGMELPFRFFLKGSPWLSRVERRAPDVF